MSRNTLMVLGLCVVVAGATGLWIFQQSSDQQTTTASPSLEVAEEQSDQLFMDSMEDSLEDDVELAVEDEIDEDSEVRFENDPGENE